ncbi:MAG: hypothetical protein N2Z73_00950, partial [Endomicrobia bacterium]|nr:hypothetical protein [Endomicrobiia bacterium]
ISNIIIFSDEEYKNKKENKEYKNEIMVKILKNYKNIRKHILTILWGNFKPFEKEYKINIDYEPMF